MSINVNPTRPVFFARLDIRSLDRSKQKRYMLTDRIHARARSEKEKEEEEGKSWKTITQPRKLLNRRLRGPARVVGGGGRRGGERAAGAR